MIQEDHGPQYLCEKDFKLIQHLVYYKIPFIHYMCIFLKLNKTVHFQNNKKLYVVQLVKKNTKLTSTYMIVKLAKKIKLTSTHMIALE